MTLRRSSSDRISATLKVTLFWQLFDWMLRSTKTGSTSIPRNCTSALLPQYSASVRWLYNASVRLYTANIQQKSMIIDLLMKLHLFYIQHTVINRRCRNRSAVYWFYNVNYSGASYNEVAVITIFRKKITNWNNVKLNKWIPVNCDMQNYYEDILILGSIGLGSIWCQALYSPIVCIFNV